MSQDEDNAKDARFTLKRWSARKLEAARQAEQGKSAPSSPVPAAAVPESAAAAPAASEGEGATSALPDVRTLTIDSDFSAFLRPQVEESLKRQALKKLFADPRFNVMDGLDVYIDDYSVPSPLTAEEVKELLHARFTLAPPATRVNAAGHVEDVPPEPESATIPPETPPASVTCNAAAPPPSATDQPSTGATTEGVDSSRTTEPGSA